MERLKDFVRTGLLDYDRKATARQSSMIWNGMCKRISLWRGVLWMMLDDDTRTRDIAVKRRRMNPILRLMAAGCMRWAGRMSALLIFIHDCIVCFWPMTFGVLSTNDRRRSRLNDWAS